MTSSIGFVIISLERKIEAIFKIIKNKLNTDNTHKKPTIDFIQLFFASINFACFLRVASALMVITSYILIYCSINILYIASRHI